MSLLSACQRLSGCERHAEAEDRDQIALNLVGAATEREDDQPAVRVLETGLEERARRVVLQVRALTEDLHQEPERLEVELGAVHLRRRGVRGVERTLRRRPRDLP